MNSKHAKRKVYRKAGTKSTDDLGDRLAEVDTFSPCSLGRIACISRGNISGES